MLGNKIEKGALVFSMVALVGVCALPLQASAECQLLSSHAGNAPLPIKAVESDTPEAKSFLETCKNPYTKIYAADPAAALAGKKKFGLYSCIACHGGDAGGLVAKGLTQDKWALAKNTTDKGMFETIAAGTDNGMVGWHQQVLNNPDLVSTDEILKIIGWIRSMYKGGDDRPWLKE